MSGPDPLDILPGPLPPGERLLWHGRPSARALARHLFRMRSVAVYFGLLALWPIAAALDAGASLSSAIAGILVPLPLAIPALGLLAVMSWAVARTTAYFITDRRIILHVGVGLTRTINIPLRRVFHAEVRGHRDGSRDVALTLQPGERLGFLALWPHARGWHFAVPQPMLRGLTAPEVERVLADALMEAAPGLRHEPTAAFEDGAANPVLAEPAHA